MLLDTMTAPGPADLRVAVTAFEHAFEQTGSADLADFLPPASDPDYPAVLIEWPGPTCGSTGRSAAAASWTTTSAGSRSNSGDPGAWPPWPRRSTRPGWPPATRSSTEQYQSGQGKRGRVAAGAARPRPRSPTTVPAPRADPDGRPAATPPCPRRRPAACPRPARCPGPASGSSTSTWSASWAAGRSAGCSWPARATWPTGRSR